MERREREEGRGRDEGRGQEGERRGGIGREKRGHAHEE